MNILRKSLVLFAGLLLATLSSLSLAEELPVTNVVSAVPETSPASDKAAAPISVAKKEVPKDLFLRGDGKCTACHDESDSPELLAIAKTKHGTAADSRTPTCTQCHGLSDDHLLNKNGTSPRPKPDRLFSGKRMDSADVRNSGCLTCHDHDSKRSHWQGSTHQSRDIACTSCHKIHVATDPVREKITQPEVCFTCHKEQRSQVNLPSHHPIVEGKVSCADCHNVHGSVGPKLMKRDSVNATCYTCHMEKRGPFVHNHEPVDDDCSTCHNPHGTTTENMLKTRAPFLCNNCHTPHGNALPGVAGTPNNASIVSFYSASVITQGKSCVNCHTQVHGSNNPGLMLPGTNSPNNAQFLLR
jgi:DmsE family decaheme c-type cytochrome